MDKVRLGVIGCGTIGMFHVRYLPEVRGAQFAAVADIDRDTARSVADEYGPKLFNTAEQMIDSGAVDAVLIASPHDTHPPYAQHAFERGVHVLTEKPVAVTARAAQQTNDAYAAALRTHTKLKFAAMFNQRTRPHWKKVKSLIDSGQVGELVRVGWTITTWFRSQAYFDSGGWRATWAGEGGGALINQCPHNLDLFWWFVGSPSRVWAVTGIGRYHDIEVEDDVTAMMTFDNGATGTFITSTGQSPGINRLEIVGDRGTIIASDRGSITFHQNEMPVSEFCRTTRERFAQAPYATLAIDPPKSKVQEHQAITQNFIDAILEDEPLVAPAVEGIHSLELGNAMLMSGLTSQPVNMPTDRDAYEQLLQQLIEKSTFKKPTPTPQPTPADAAKSF